MIGRLGFYVRQALKFYDIKGEGIAPAVFVVILSAGFVGALMPGSLLENRYFNYSYNFISMSVIYFVSAIYQSAYINDLRKKKYNLDSLKSLIAHRGKRIAAVSVIVSLLSLPVTLFAELALSDTGQVAQMNVFLKKILTGTLLMLIYAAVMIFLYLMYLFVFSYIIDKNHGVMEALRASRTRTKGRRGQIFAIIIVFNVILFFATMITMLFAGAFQNVLILSFVTTFVASIFSLVQQRLIALMYNDLEYGSNNY